MLYFVNNLLDFIFFVMLIVKFSSNIS